MRTYFIVIRIFFTNPNCMRKQIIIILLIGLMFSNSVSGFMTVICHGTDGHICVEPVNHSHCDCSIQNELNSEVQEIPPEISGVLFDDHIHCTDTLRELIFYAIKPNNLKPSILKILTSNFFCSLIKVYNYSPDTYLISNINNLSDFFIPLQTIVILA